MPMPSNYPPGVTGNEPEIIGYDDEDDNHDGCRKMLVCRQCGEAFDDVDIAYAHRPGDCGSDQGWDILPECEAM